MSDYFLAGQPSPSVLELIAEGAEIPAHQKHDVHLVLLEAMARYACSLKRLRAAVKCKPLMGEVWGHGQYVLASHLEYNQNLYEVTYLVLEAKTWLPLGSAVTKTEAMGSARHFLKTVEPSLLARFIALLVIRQEADERASEHARKERNAELIAARTKAAPHKPTRIGRRRKQIFEESDGKCHYCATPLTLDGRWHIEHKMPKALGGGDEPTNLVASCAPCNHKKLDRTDVEFIAMQKASAS